MSLTTQPKQTIQSHHALSDATVETVAEDNSHDITYNELTESLNLLQALLSTEQDLQTFFSELERPEKLHELTEEHAVALITPVTWWELQAHTDWGNRMDQAILTAHKTEFIKRTTDTDATYSSHEFKTLHPIVSQINYNPHNST